jgi:hypothetical protein
MANVKPRFANASGGYQQPVTAGVDTVSTGSLWLQPTTGADTNCGLTRTGTTQLALFAAGGPSGTVNATAATPTLNVPLADGSGNSVVISGGTLDTTAGLLFPDLTTQTVTPRIAYRSTNVTNITTTPVSTGLSFSVTAGVAYAFDFYGIFGRTFGTSAALRFSFVTPTLGASSYVAYRNNQGPGLTSTPAYQQNTFATAFTMTPAAGGTTSTVYTVLLNGFFFTSVSGTFDLRFSPSLANDAMTVFPGTYLSLRVATT